MCVYKAYEMMYLSSYNELFFLDIWVSKAKTFEESEFCYFFRRRMKRQNEMLNSFVFSWRYIEYLENISEILHEHVLIVNRKAFIYF